MKARIWSVSPALVVCLALLASYVRAATSDPAFQQLDSIVKTLAGITGLPEKHPVPYGRMNKRELRQFLSKRIKKTLRPEEIRADELALKMFGFVPQDFNLRKSTTDLLTEQAAAFYDYDEKRLFLMSESSVSSEATTLAHELSHALADQYFNLENFMDEKPSNDDENLAHSAVVEGQASWLMIAYGLAAAGQNPAPTPDMLRSITASDSASSADYPVLADAPLYIQQSLLFPYASGTSFFDAVYRRLGQQAFAEVFRNPPSDSAQIIHPDRYFEHQAPTKPSLPQVQNAGEENEITEGSVGEFDHQMLIRQYTNADHGKSLAPHLRGGQFQINRFAKRRRPVLRYISEWDSPSTAADFFGVYRKILSGKSQHCDFTLINAGILAGTTERGLFITRLSGNFVSSVEGLSDAAEWQRLKSSH